MISGDSVRSVLPSDVLTCRPQNPPVASNVSRLGMRLSSAFWPSMSSSAGKKSWKPPLSLKTRSVSFVLRFADGSMSMRTTRFSMISWGENRSIFSRITVLPPLARSRCCRYGWSRSRRLMSVCR